MQRNWKEQFQTPHLSPLPFSEGRGVAPIRNQRTPPSTRHAHLFSNAKIVFQSFFMLMTVQPFFFASS